MVASAAAILSTIFENLLNEIERIQGEHPQDSESKSLPSGREPSNAMW